MLFRSRAFSTQELRDKLHQIDMPLVIVSGFAEMIPVFPINEDAPFSPADNWKFILPEDRSGRIEAWQNRLYSVRCPIPSAEDIAAAAGGNTVEQKLGFPCDSADIFHLDGLDYYIGDITNTDGNKHFRVIGIENFPHATCSMMHQLSWSFIKRFKRDTDSHRVVPLF